MSNSTFRYCASAGLNIQLAQYGDSIYVHHNTFFNNGTDELRHESSGMVTFARSRGTIAYNLFVGNTNGLVVLSGLPRGDDVLRFYIFNNTFVNNEVIGMTSPHEAWCFICNNIVTGSEEDITFGFGRAYNNNSFDNDNTFIVEDLDSINANGIPCDRFGDFSIDPGFVGGDHFSYELQPNSPCIDIGYPGLPQDEDGTLRDLGAFPAFQDDEFEIILAERWSIISLPLWTPIRRIELQIEPFIDIENLLLLKDEDGRFWVPEFNFSNLDPFDHHKGYMVKMDVRETFPDTGVFIPADEPIPLHEGWQMVAYYPETELEAPEAFASIVDNLLIAKDHMGNFYFPEEEFNNMQPLRRGLGYMLKMRSDDVLIYQEGEERIR